MHGPHPIPPHHHPRHPPPHHPPTLSGHVPPQHARASAARAHQQPGGPCLEHAHAEARDRNGAHHAESGPEHHPAQVGAPPRSQPAGLPACQPAGLPACQPARPAGLPFSAVLPAVPWPAGFQGFALPAAHSPPPPHDHAAPQQLTPACALNASLARSARPPPPIRVHAGLGRGPRASACQCCPLPRQAQARVHQAAAASLAAAAAATTEPAAAAAAAGPLCRGPLRAARAARRGA